MARNRGRLSVVSPLAGSASKPSGPQRTCVGCRTVAPRDLLLRIVAEDGAAVADVSRRMPGRGANVHRTAECIQLAIRRKSLHRALRAPDLRTDDLQAWIQSGER